MPSTSLPSSLPSPPDPASPRSSRSSTPRPPAPRTAASPRRSPSSTRSSPGSASPSRTKSSGRLELIDVYHLIYPRDRLLLALLEDHLVLTTSQITQALFGSPRACQQRLARLHSLELVDRFTLPRPAKGGSVEWHWTLGRLGLDLHAASREEPTTTPERPRRGWRA